MSRRAVENRRRVSPISLSILDGNDTMVAANAKRVFLRVQTSARADKVALVKRRAERNSTTLQVVF
jgi:hypothetical protein